MLDHYRAPTEITEIMEETSFNEPTANITDVILVVGDQRMFACKKILAQYSLYFYDLFYGEEANTNIEEYEIKEANCHSFRLFLRLLYYQNVTINMDNFQSLVELSFRFKADYCLEECERFLIKQDIANGLKLKHAQGFNFKILHDYVFKTYKTIDDVVEIEKDENYAHFGTETKLAMLARMIEIKRGEKFEEIALNTPGTEVRTIFGVPWKITFTKFVYKMTVKVECELCDNVNPWKFQVTIEFRGTDCIESYCQVSALKTDVTVMHRIKKSSGDLSNYTSHIRIYPIHCLYEPRSISFQEIRPNLTDVVLSVGGKKFHVSKQILANQSSYFDAIFYSGFIEKGKDEIELKEIDSTEFETFLQFIYNPNRLVSTDIIDGLLKLSQMYDAQLILQKCEAFLKMKDSMNDVMRMKIAEKYNFTSLFETILSNIRSYNDFVNISRLEGFEELKDDSIGKIARHVM